MTKKRAGPFARWTGLALTLLLAVAALGCAAGAQESQSPATAPIPAYPSLGGLEHFEANDQTVFAGVSVTLPVGYRHQVCLVSDASVRPGGAAASASGASGPTWVITATQGAPTLEGVAVTHPNEATETMLARETCVYWTSSAPGTQAVLLQDGGRVLADDSRYTATDSGSIPAPVALRVRWVNVTAIGVTRGGRAVTAPIAQRLDFYGTDARGDHYRTNATVRVNVSVTPGGLDTANVAGVPVTFAVTGACGTVTAPGAVGVGVERGVIGAGETGSVQWGGAPTAITFANPFCASPAASTTVAITAGEASASVSVNWAWEGYAAISVTDVGDDGTEKRVTFHTAAPVYRGERVAGYVCDSQMQARSVAFAVSGGSTFVDGGRRQTRTTLSPITGARIAADAEGPAAQSPGAFGLADSECRQSWTVRSPARSDDVSLTVTSAGFTATRALDFTEREARMGTLGQLDVDIVDGGSTIVAWTFDSTPVEDSLGDLRVLALYFWDARAQRWLSWFPNAEGLGVNTLASLERDGIYTVVTGR